MNIPNAVDLLEKFKNSIKIEEYGEIIENNNFWDRQLLLKEIDSEVSDAIESMIRFWNDIDNKNKIPVEKRTPIKIYIDSDGGELCATFTIIDSIKMSKTPVWTINIGAAYSGGFFSFICGHRRFIYPNATLLYHEGSTASAGDANKFQNFATFYKEQVTKLKNITLKNSNIPSELYEEKRRDDWWINAEEAIELSLADEILETFI